MSSIYLAPFQMNALATSGFPRATTGLLVSTSILGTAVASILSSLTVRDARQLAILGILLTLAGQLGSAFEPGLTMMWIARATAGAGCGLTLTSGNVLLAATHSHTAFGRAYTGLSLVFVIVSSLLPHIIDVRQLPAFFFTYTALIAVLGTSVSFVPGVKRNSSHGSVFDRDLFGRREVLLLLIGSTAFFFTAGAAFVSSGPAASRIGVSDREYGLILSVYALVGTLGSAFVGVVGNRLGYSLPMGIGMVVTACTFVGLFVPNNAVVLALSVCLFGFCFLALTSYLLSFSSAADPSGRLAAFFGGYPLLPYSLGPAAAAVASEALGWTGVALVSVIVASISSAVCAIAVRIAERSRLPNSPSRTPVELSPP